MVLRIFKFRRLYRDTMAGEERTQRRLSRGSRMADLADFVDKLTASSVLPSSSRDSSGFQLGEFSETADVQTYLISLIPLRLRC